MKAFINLLFICITISFMSCNCQKKEKITNIIEPITVNVLKNKDNSIQLVDVRTPEEYSQGYIKNAININFYSEDFLQVISKLNKEQPIYVYCKVGGRSSNAAIKLKNLGFLKIYDLEGGFLKWKTEANVITKH